MPTSNQQLFEHVFISCVPKVHTGASAPKTTSQELSTEYTKDMQEKMGDTILTYDHSAGMNYAHILDDLIIGSCLQTPADADR